jgi:hypothetical protein
MFIQTNVASTSAVMSLRTLSAMGGTASEVEGAHRPAVAMIRDYDAICT